MDLFVKKHVFLSPKIKVSCQTSVKSMLGNSGRLMVIGLVQKAWNFPGKDDRFSKSCDNQLFGVRKGGGTTGNPLDK